jgi:hypothetical protein
MLLENVTLYPSCIPVKAIECWQFRFYGTKLLHIHLKGPPYMWMPFQQYSESPLSFFLPNVCEQ